MSVKFLFSTFVILLITLTFFALDTVADSESSSDKSVNPRMIILICFGLLVVLVVAGMIYSARLSTKKGRIFLQENKSLLSSEDPKTLLELAEKSKEHLKDRYSAEIASLSQQARAKAARILRESDFQAKLETFKSEISEDGSHPSVVATLKEQMHNPDSFQHVSSDYETIKQEGKHYQKIVMTFRGTNTFNALVLQTCYFLIDEDNQVSLVGSPDNTESSPVTTAQLSASIDAASQAFEGVTSLADLLLFFTSGE